MSEENRTQTTAPMYYTDLIEAIETDIRRIWGSSNSDVDAVASLRKIQLDAIVQIGFDLDDLEPEAFLDPEP